LLLGSEGGEITIKGALGTVKGAACPTNTPLFIVGRIRSSTAQNDEIRLKVYNANTETVHASDGLLSGVGGGTNQWTLISSDNANNIFDQLFIEAGGTGTTIGTHHALIDEIRIGETWSDVTGL
jgi:tryptophan synthase beta subunit